MKLAWFSPVAGDERVVEYSRGVLDEFNRTAGVRALRVGPEAVLELRSFDAVFYNLADNYSRYGWILELAHRHPGIVVVHDSTLHRLFLAYYVQHLHRPDLYISRMAEHYGIEGLRTAHRVLEASLDAVNGVSYPFTEEVCQFATRVVAPAAAPELLRLAEPDAYAADLNALAERQLRPIAERIATHVGEILWSLGATPDSPGVDQVINEASGLLWPSLPSGQ